MPNQNNNLNNNSWKPNDKAIIIAAIIGASATIIGIIATGNDNSNVPNNAEVSNNIIINNNGNYISSETENNNEQAESTTIASNETFMYESQNTSTSWNEDSNAAVVTTIPPVSDFDQSFYKSTSYAETTYSNKATESTTLSTTYLETVPFDWDYFNTQYNQESSTNAITIGEANEYDLVNSIYEVTLEKCEPNLLRFYVRGNLNLFSLPDEQNWETSFKSNGVLYAAQLTTNGKEILSNKVHTFEYKNGGIYYYFTSKEEIVLACAEEAINRIEQGALDVVFEDLNDIRHMMEHLGSMADQMSPTMRFLVSVCVSQEYGEKVKPSLVRLAARYPYYTRRIARLLDCDESEVEPFVHLSILAINNYMIFAERALFDPQIEAAKDGLLALAKRKHERADRQD